jgi:hypothetical protein
MVKCPLIGDKLGAKKGDFVVANNHLMKNEPLTGKRDKQHD